jgi:outer membrane protein assembly factor BamB
MEVEASANRVVVRLAGKRCTGDGDVVAVDARSGRETWRSRVSGPRYGETMAVDRTVVALVSGTVVTGVDARNGATRWVAKDLPPTDAGGLVFAAGGLFVVEKKTSDRPPPAALLEPGPPSAALFALQASNGQPRWTYTPDPSDEVLAAVADGSTVIASTFGPVDSPTPARPTNKLVALDRETGRPLWHRELGSWESTFPIVARDGVVVFSGQTLGTSRTFDSGSRLVALSSTTGAVLWDKTGATAMTTGLSIDQGSVYLSTADGTVEALDATTGTPRWQQRAKSVTRGVSSRVEAAGSGIVLVERVESTRSATAYALAARDGHDRWRLHAAATTGTISNASVYVAGGGARQVCD